MKCLTKTCSRYFNRCMLIETIDKCLLGFDDGFEVRFWELSQSNYQLFDQKNAIEYGNICVSEWKEHELGIK